MCNNVESTNATVRFVATITLILFIFGTRFACAQSMEYKDFWLRSYSDIGRVLIDEEIMPRFKETMNKGEIDKLKNLRIVISKSFNPYETYARLENGEPVIYISGFLIQMIFMSFEANGLEEFVYKKPERYNKYIVYMLEAVRDNVGGMKIGRKPNPVERYWDYLNVEQIDREKLKDTPEMKEFSEYSLFASMNALSFILAHELAHVLHNDISTTRFSIDNRRKAERAADLYAIVLMQKSNMHALAAGPFMLMVGAFDQNPTGFDEADLYDRPWCRAFLLGISSYKTFLERFGNGEVAKTGLDQIKNAFEQSECQNK